MADYQWYPGHMTKAKRMMQENIKLVDLIIELTDARIPVASRNPDIDTLANGKGRVLLLNKSDLADERATRAFIKYYEEKGCKVIPLDARNRKGNDQVKAYVREVCAAKLARDKKRGIIGRPLRAMVVGIPNVGKSTFINSFAGKACAKTGNKPGVTKGKQWIRLAKDLELLDTPGILWPKFDDKITGIRLALVGAINEDILDLNELSLLLISYLQESYPGVLEAHYGAEGEVFPKDGTEALIAIGKSRNLLLKGQEIDVGRASRMLLDDFKNGRIGRISLEMPPTE